MGYLIYAFIPGTGPDWVACPHCGTRNNTAAVKNPAVEMRPVLTEAIPFFPEAMAQVFFLECVECAYRICLDYSVELDDCPVMDLNGERVAEPA